MNRVKSDAINVLSIMIAFVMTTRWTLESMLDVHPKIIYVTRDNQQRSMNTSGGQCLRAHFKLDRTFNGYTIHGRTYRSCNRLSQGRLAPQ